MSFDFNAVTSFLSKIHQLEIDYIINLLCLDHSINHPLLSLPHYCSFDHRYCMHVTTVVLNNLLCYSVYMFYLRLICSHIIGVYCLWSSLIWQSLCSLFVNFFQPNFKKMLLASSFFESNNYIVFYLCNYY